VGLLGLELLQPHHCRLLWLQRLVVQLLPLRPHQECLPLWLELCAALLLLLDLRHHLQPEGL